MPITPKDVERRVYKDPMCGCWIWLGSDAGNGYPQYGGHQTRFKVHRFMYEATNGPIPKHLQVRHRCDVPMCVNPYHLEIGTVKDNAQDRKKRGRGATKERNGFARFTEAQIEAIRADTRPQPVIAKEYGTTQQYISMIQLRKVWV